MCFVVVNRKLNLMSMKNRICGYATCYHLRQLLRCPVSWRQTVNIVVILFSLTELMIVSICNICLVLPKTCATVDSGNVYGLTFTVVCSSRTRSRGIDCFKNAAGHSGLCLIIRHTRSISSTFARRSVRFMDRPEFWRRASWLRLLPTRLNWAIIGTTARFTAGSVRLCEGSSNCSAPDRTYA